MEVLGHVSEKSAAYVRLVIATLGTLGQGQRPGRVLQEARGLGREFGLGPPSPAASPRLTVPY